MITIGEYTGRRKPLPCDRKERHPSQGKAEAHLRAILRQEKCDDRDRLNAYRCGHCGGWHVGRLPP